MPTHTSKYNDLKAEAAVWANPESFATVLVVLFIDTYGTEAFSWHPNTIQMEVEDDFRIDLPSTNLAKLMTGIDLFNTDNFFVSLPDFVRSCVVLSNGGVSQNQLTLPDSDDCAWGITEAMLLNPPEEEEPFSDEIRAFVGKVLDQEGILTPPDVLRIALRDKDLANDARYGFSDDPEMFGAIQGMQAGKTDEINHLIKFRLKTMASQLKNVPLGEPGKSNMQRVVAKILQALPSDQDMPLPV